MNIIELKEDIEKAKKIEMTKKLEWLAAEAELKSLEAVLNLMLNNLKAQDLVKELERRKNGTD